MIYEELKGEVFSEAPIFKFIQCISADLAMDKGITVDFNEKYDTKTKMYEMNPYTLISEWDSQPAAVQGFCVYSEPVFNLVTKRRYYDKPTLYSMGNAIVSLKNLCMRHNIVHLAIQNTKGSIDRLKWEDVSMIFMDVLGDLDITVHVWNN